MIKLNHTKELSIYYCSMDPPDPTQISETKLIRYTEHVILDGLCEGLMQANFHSLEGEAWDWYEHYEGYDYE